MTTATETKYTFWEAIFILPITMLVMSMAASAVTILLIPIGLLTAWIRSLLWTWFAVPYLHLPPLGVWQMFGIGLIISVAYHTNDDEKKKPNKEVWTVFIGRVLSDLIALAIGFGIHHWILR